MANFKESPLAAPIPVDWKVPERQTPDLYPGAKVVLLDVDERFLSITRPDGDLTDYFFGEEGEITDTRYYNDYNPYLRICGDNRVIFQIFYLKDYMTFEAGFSGETEHLGRLSYIVAAPKERLADPDLPLGKLVTASLASVFNEQEDMRPRHITLFKRRLETGLASGLSTEDWDVPEAGGFRQGLVFSEATPNVCFSENKEFSYEWQVVDGILVLSQIHIPTQIRKILQGPVRFNMQEVQETFTARSFRDERRKVEEGRIVAPWRDIDKIVRARLYYQRPLPEGITIPGAG